MVSLKNSFTTFSRVSEWWHFKLALFSGIVYATFYYLGQSLVHHLLLLLSLLFSLMAGALFVSITNDYTDKELDKKVGKKNPFIGLGKARTFLYVSFASLLVLSIAFLWFRFSFYASLWYGCACVSYILYAFPPFRLKERHLWGVLADALGAHLFPTLFVLVVLFTYFNKSFDVMWFAALGIWALMYGLRGILWHQLLDFGADFRANIQTFVVKYGKAPAVWWGTKIIFRLEIVAFLSLFILLQSLWLGLFGFLYFLLIWVRKAVWRVNVILVAPKPRYYIWGTELYAIYFPLAVLLSLLSLSLSNFWVLLLHLLIFKNAILQTLQYLPQAWQDTRANYLEFKLHQA